MEVISNDRTRSNSRNYGKWNRLRCRRFVDVEALKVAVNALGEIRRYRAIGTVEKFIAMKEKEEQREEWERRTVVCKNADTEIWTNF